MKITVRQLKQLVREAVFAQPVKLGMSGTGLWHGEQRRTGAGDEGVHITKLVLDTKAYDQSWYDAPTEWARLKVYFKNWSNSKNGLIYTDPRFIKEFRKVLLTLGFSDKAARSADYSEQGMQGRNFVDMMVNRKFMDEWEDLVGAKSIEL